MKTTKLKRQQLDNIWYTLPENIRWEVDTMMTKETKSNLVGELQIALGIWFSFNQEDKLMKLTKYQLALLIAKANYCVTHQIKIISNII